MFAITLVVDPDLLAVSNAREVTARNRRRQSGRALRQHDEDVDLSGRLRGRPAGSYRTRRRGWHPVAGRARTGQGQPDRVRSRSRCLLPPLAGRLLAIPYPGDKMDFIAIPTSRSGRWRISGAATSRENAVLVDPHVARQVELERVSSVIAHEFAHMWFGNLVTMEWWDGLWLNEAFATFMEMMASDSFRPEWKTWLEFAPIAAMPSTQTRWPRPGRQFDVDAPDEADQMFDSLTYQKGSALLRMLQQYLGEETFRRGVGEYLQANAYGNTETHDLWTALEEASGQPVGAMMNSWIFQEGFPEVEIFHSPEGDGLLIEQRRFAYLPEVSGGEWHVPIVVRFSDGATEKTSTSIVGGSPGRSSGTRPRRMGGCQRRRKWLLPGPVHARVDGRPSRTSRPARPAGAVHVARRHMGAGKSGEGRLRYLSGSGRSLSGRDRGGGMGVSQAGSMGRLHRIVQPEFAASI